MVVRGDQGRTYGIQHSIDHSNDDHGSSDPYMRVAGPRPSTGPLEIRMMHVSQYQLEDQHNHYQDPDNLVYCGE
jgi:hypothetical protein